MFLAIAVVIGEFNANQILSGINKSKVNFIYGPLQSIKLDQNNNQPRNQSKALLKTHQDLRKPIPTH